MKIFNRLFKAEITKVKIKEHGEWYCVKEISENRKLISLYRTCGSFQRSDITKFTNKEDVY